MTLAPDYEADVESTAVEVGASGIAGDSGLAVESRYRKNVPEYFAALWERKDVFQSIRIDDGAIVHCTPPIRSMMKERAEGREVSACERS